MDSIVFYLLPKYQCMDAWLYDKNTLNCWSHFTSTWFVFLIILKNEHRKS